MHSDFRRNGDGAMELLFLYEGGQLAQALIDSQGRGVADQREVYAGGARVRLEADTNGDGRPDVVQYFSGGQVVRQDEDADYDGVVDQRFEGNQPVNLPAGTKLPGARFGKLGCGNFHRFWWKR